jgi:hypothetical protein
MLRKHSKTLLNGLLFGAMAATPALAASPASSVPIPQVSGPIAAPDVPGAPSRNYIFFASNHDLAAHGYVEEEFFVKGNASTYDLADLKTATVKDSGHPYLTRIVVRRPADPKRFNGTVITEWDNVTNFFDAENLWFFDWESIMRDGYVWVGVSPQTVGVDALKKWSPNRYGALDVGGVVASSSLVEPGIPDADAESFDIFSQAGQALRHPSGVDPLHGLRPKVFIAAGESQSARRLAMYVNSVQPLARVYDGFLLLSAIGQKIRGDLVSPVFKINTEHDVVTGDAAALQPDTDKFRSWDVAGTSHVDQHLRTSREALELRDNGKSLEAAMATTCAVPQVGTRVPTSYVVASAMNKLSRWAAGGPPPPSAPHLTVLKVVPRPGESEIARNKDHLAEGGIQLSEIAVPTQLNYGVGSASKAAQDAGIQGEAIGPGACIRWGYSLDYTLDQLNSRYPSHAAYVAQVRQVTQNNLRHGYILPADAAATIHEAEDSQIGDH